MSEANATGIRTTKTPGAHQPLGARATSPARMTTSTSETPSRVVLASIALNPRERTDDLSHGGTPTAGSLYRISRRCRLGRPTRAPDGRFLQLHYQNVGIGDVDSHIFESGPRSHEVLFVSRCAKRGRALGVVLAGDIGPRGDESVHRNIKPFAPCRRKSRGTVHRPLLVARKGYRRMSINL